MNYTNWKNVAELAGVAAIVGSLIFVGMELRQQHLMARNEAQFAVVESGREVSNAIIENADNWLRGNAGEELNGAEEAVYLELIRLAWARAYWTATTFQGLGNTPLVANPRLCSVSASKSRCPESMGS